MNSVYLDIKIKKINKLVVNTILSKRIKILLGNILLKHSFYYQIGQDKQTYFIKNRTLLRSIIEQSSVFGLKLF